jgi:hypothetical protein
VTSARESSTAALEMHSLNGCRYLKNAAALKLATGPYKVRLPPACRRAFALLRCLTHVPGCS